MGVMSRVLKAIRSAESEVTRLEGAVARWQGEAEAKRAELAELRASAGQRVFADETGTASRTLALEAQDLQFQIEGAEAAAVVAEQQLEEARDELALAVAVEKRDQAAKLTREADEHQAKVDALLNQLEALDGPRYVPFEPSADDRRYAAQMNHELSWIVSKAVLMRDPIAPLLAEAEALERPVQEKRAARERAAASLTPSAQIIAPAWDDIDSTTQLSCSVTEGRGTATFEVSAGGQQGGNWTVSLPDEQGRRSWGRSVKIQAGGGHAVIRCNGEVLAQVTRPGRLLNDGLAHWWVETDPGRIARARS